VVTAPAVTLVGVQTSDDARVPGVTVTVAVAVPLSVAVTVTVCEVVTDPDVAMKLAEVALAGTVTDAGTGSAAVLLDVNATALPPDGAAWLSVTVQVVAAPDVTVDGAQASDDTRTTGVTVTVAVTLPPSVAVTVTV
jgi:hypothetical protein